MNTKKRRDSTNLTPKSYFQYPETSARRILTGNQHRVSGIEFLASSIQHQASNIQEPASTPRPFIIPIFIPHAGCPHRCIFCNQDSITGATQKLPTPAELRSQIRKFLDYKKENRKPVQIAFFGGNFLGLKREKIISLLELATDFIREGLVDGIRCSTRPDTINEESLDMITDYPVSTVELGVQSMNDRVLTMAGRGHSALDTVHAVERLNERYLSIGLQMMVGLPGDDENGALTTAQRMADLGPDFVRIYPTVVVANSRLAKWYQRGEYVPLSLAESVTLVKKIYLKFKKASINVIRMGLQTSEDLKEGTTVLAGPHHPAFGHLVHSEIFLDMTISAIESAKVIKDPLTVFVNPRCISKMRGLKNANIKRLQRRFQLTSLVVKPDASVPEESVRIE